MSEGSDNKTGKKPLSLSKKLELSKIVDNAGNRQGNRSSKTVVVEVKGGAPKTGSSRSPSMGPRSPKPGNADTLQKRSNAKRTVKVERRYELTEGERSARMQALKGAGKFALETEALADESRKVHEANRQAMDDAARRREEAEAAQKKKEADTSQGVVGDDQVLPPVDKPDTHHKHHLKKEDKDSFDQEDTEEPTTAAEGQDAKTRSNQLQAKKVAGRKGEERRRSSKIRVTQALVGEDEYPRMRSLASIKRAREKEKIREKEEFTPHRVVREVILPETIIVQDLANRMAERVSDIIKSLMKAGVMVTATKAIDADTAELIVSEFGHTVKRVSDEDVEDILSRKEDKLEDMQDRPPVVTIMGHVDHGKTSLLDALRSTDVVSGEAGGITQHIGAYQILNKAGQRITFIDTPGHAAFTQMRARGADVTDIVILVVAADDGVKDQTIEAIRHAKAAGAPIIVAVNKIDKPGADPMRVQNELLHHEVFVEHLGGDILCAEVSAKEKINLDKLEEAIALQAEMMELKANPKANAEGIVIEAKLEKGRGPVATVLVQRGTIRVGDIFVVGQEWGKVRALISDHGDSISSAVPSQPVEVVGINAAPHAGDRLIVVEEESIAREVAQHRFRKHRLKEVALREKSRLEHMFNQPKEGDVRDLSIIIKGDVQGSVEAIAASLSRIEAEGLSINIVHTGVGAISETDVSLAETTDALIIGFNVRAGNQARDHAQRSAIDIRYYSIIYDVIDDVKAIASGLLAPNIREEFIGKAEIRQVFSISKIGTIAGCFVTDGIVKRGSKIRLLRDDIVIHEGDLKTLKRFKDEVKEVKTGYECGMAFEKYNDLREGDIIECSELVEEARKI